MIGVVDDTKLPGGDAVDGGVRMDDEGVGSGLLQRAGEVLRGMAYLEPYPPPLRGLGGEPMHVMDREIRLIG